MKKILVTCFAPFDHRGTNQSSLIAHRLHSSQLTILELPVVFQGAYDVLKEHLNSHSYDVILALGEGPNRTIALEHIAVNVMHARIPDNQGFQPCDTTIDPTLPLSLPSTLPLNALAARLDQNHHLYHHSYSAGTYVCNDLFYRLMAAPLSIPRGFIHVSYEKEFEVENLKAIQCVVDYLSALK